MSRVYRQTPGALLYHSPTYSPKTGSLTEPRASLAPRIAQGSSCLCAIQCPDYRLTCAHTWLFLWDPEGPHTCGPRVLPHCTISSTPLCVFTVSAKPSEVPTSSLSELLPLSYKKQSPEEHVSCKVTCEISNCKGQKHLLVLHVTDLGFHPGC